MKQWTIRRLIDRVADKLIGGLQRHRYAKLADLHAEWEQFNLRRLLAALSVDCVFDVGANEGQYASMLRQKVGYSGLILSFEPNPDAAAKVREASARDPLWTVHEIAISNRDGLVGFNVMRNSQFSSLGNPQHTEVSDFKELNQVMQRIEVPAETLTTAYERLRREHGFERPFLKLDTQGFDVEIVRHAGPALQHFVGLQSELAIKRLYDTSIDFRDALATYQQNGFELSAFVPNNEGHFPYLYEIDCIIMRSDIAARLRHDVQRR
jgi:FkbM family methyltransferase